MSEYAVAIEDALARLDVIPDYNAGNGPEPCVHTFVEGGFGLLGAHWSLASAEEFMRKWGVEKSGTAARRMGHGLVVPASDRPGPVFFATDAHKGGTP